MHKPASLQENKTDRILCDFDMQMDHKLQLKKPDPEIINKTKKNLPFSRFFSFGGPQSKNKRKQKDRQILGSCQRIEIKKKKRRT